MKQLKRIISCWLVVCMLVTMIPANALAATQKNEGYIMMEGEERQMPPINLFGEGLAAYALDGNGNPELKDSNEVRWIDRLADLPEYAIEFYEWLEENTDGDRNEDALINPLTGLDIDGKDNTYVHPVTTASGNEVRYTYTPGASDEEIQAAAEDAINATIYDVLDNVDPYIFSVFCAFDRDHPEVFWLSGQTQFQYGITYTYEYNTNRDGNAKVIYDVDFYFILLVREKFDARIPKYRAYTTIYNTISNRDSWVEEISANANGNFEEKTRYFNEWLTMNNCYNTSYSQEDIDVDSWECISALEGNEGTAGPVCEGYARAFKVLCDEAGIPCVLVDGEALGEPHMWNYVQMDDGKWYAVDVTWNDPSAQDVEEKVSGLENEDYFLVGSSTYIEADDMLFEESHVLRNIVADGGVEFTNGPILEEVSYVPHEHADLEMVEGYEATCTEDGQKTYYVCDCGRWFEDEEATVVIEDHDSVILPMTGHDYKSATEAPTCTEKGYTIHACALCGESYIDNYVDPTGHTFSEWTETKVPTCTENGEETRSCACGETETRAIAPIDHVYDAEPDFVWAEDNRTCKAVFKCSYECGVDYETDCVIKAESSDATCTVPGTVKYTATCTMGEDTYSDSYSVTGVTLDHEFEPVFTWSDDKSMCVAAFECNTCDLNDTINCTVTKETVEKGILYTAVCTFEGKEYKEEILELILPFTDVSEDAWYYDSVKYVYEHDFMNGATTTTFEPDWSLTRSMFATILHRMNGKPEVDYKDTFADVPDNEWYTDGIMWASETGVVNGYNDGTFGTEDNISREQIAVMMYRYANYMKYDTTKTAELDQYEDAGEISDWAKDAMYWAVGCGLIKGKTATTIDPLGEASRAECATIIMRFDQLYK